GRWEMGDGRWEMGDGRWEMGRKAGGRNGGEGIVAGPSQPAEGGRLVPDSAKCGNTKLCGVRPQ
ncbi:MAG TPA: hypothetical protein VK137_10625, partial [Planctomycetaceae bacterium]|nr:hypothetical protein [Planctomycetaceae bacterium]